MYSESSTLKDCFEYPGQGNEATLGRPSHSKNQTRRSNDVYFRIQVIKRVASFLEIIKSNLVRTDLGKSSKRPIELDYLQSSASEAIPDPLLKYDNKLTLFFDLFIIVLLSGLMWCNSYELVFSGLSNSLRLRQIVLVAYIVHLIVLLNSEHKNKKLQIISQRHQILQSYAQTRLLFDMALIGTIALQLTGLDDDNTFAVTTRVLGNSVPIQSGLIAYWPLNELTHKVENIFAVSSGAEITISIVTLIVRILTILHCLSMLLVSVAKIQQKNGVTSVWVQKTQIQINNDFQLYILGWYWGSTIISTVGFGDITPSTTIERVVISMIEVFSSMIFGYFVNYIGSLISLMGESQKIYERDIRQLNRYLNQLKVLPDTLKNSMRSHIYNNYQTETLYCPREEQEVFSKLTESLRAQVVQLNNTYVAKLSQRLQLFSEETLSRIAGVMNKLVLAPQQTLYSQSSKELKLYILEEGSVEEFISKSPTMSKVISIYTKGEECTVGWINFVRDTLYETYAKAKTFSIAYEIKRDEFIEIIKANRIDYMRFLELRDLMIQRKRKYINKCIICDRYTHNAVSCPKVHFVPSKPTQQIARYGLQLIEQKRSSSLLRHAYRSQWKQGFSLQFQPEIEQIVSKRNSRLSLVCTAGSGIHPVNGPRMSTESVVDQQKSLMAMTLKENAAMPSEKTFHEEEPQQIIIDRVDLSESKIGYFPHHNCEMILKQDAMKKEKMIERQLRPANNRRIKFDNNHLRIS